jgi:hypothetical protein
MPYICPLSTSGYKSESDILRGKKRTLSSKLVLLLKAKLVPLQATKAFGGEEV